MVGNYRILFLARPLGCFGFSWGSTCRSLVVSSAVASRGKSGKPWESET